MVSIRVSVMVTLVKGFGLGLVIGLGSPVLNRLPVYGQPANIPSRCHANSLMSQLADRSIR